MTDWLNTRSLEELKRALKDTKSEVIVGKKNRLVVREIIDMSTLKAGDEIESYYSDIKYKENLIVFNRKDKELDNTVTPGIHYIGADANGNLLLTKTSFTQDKILDSLTKTQDIEKYADCFIKNIHKYKDLGVDVPKRSILLWGPPGTGKSAAINKVCNKYVAQGDVAVIIYQTDKYSSYDVKDFLKELEYPATVQKLIFIMEDLGGVETADMHSGSDPALLSILDNQERIFKIPTLIISTTNFPETLLENITNRPGRVDDKVKVSYPDANDRVTLLEFFTKRKLTEEEIKIVKDKKCDEFSVAHIKESVIKSIIHEKTLVAATKEIIKDIEIYKKNFKDKEKSLGLGGFE